MPKNVNNTLLAAKIISKYYPTFRNAERISLYSLQNSLLPISALFAAAECGTLVDGWRFA
jgi:hypothetical protein